MHWHWSVLLMKFIRLLAATLFLDVYELAKKFGNVNLAIEVVKSSQVLNFDLIDVRANLLHCHHEHVLRNDTSSPHVVFSKFLLEVLVVALDTVYNTLHYLGFICA